jgi:hypothetical protein
MKDIKTKKKKKKNEFDFLLSANDFIIFKASVCACVYRTNQVTHLYVCVCATRQFL